jgi:hypothetical protein
LFTAVGTSNNTCLLSPFKVLDPATKRYKWPTADGRLAVNKVQV